MAFKIRYDPRVQEDLSSLPRNMQRRIIQAIEQRLAVDPSGYGLRLRKSLAGFWKLRVGDYRIVYSLEPALVTIFVVGHRREAYAVAGKRLEASRNLQNKKKPGGLDDRRARALARGDVGRGRRRGIAGMAAMRMVRRLRNGAARSRPPVAYLKERVTDE